MLNTEMRNEKSMHIDKMTTLEMVRLMNQENYNSLKAVENETESIIKAIDAISESIGAGGKLVYIGAGTSGRLGVIDAAECPPTFGIKPDIIKGIIAGGMKCMYSASEDEEDRFENGIRDVENVLKKGDVLVGISAAGGAQYVLGAMSKAKETGCVTVSLTSNKGSPVDKAADISICCGTGAEVITGSTRLKAGNSQKFVLNMLSTCSMIKTGNVYENMMINLKPTNQKLRERVINITAEILRCGRDEAAGALEKHGYNIRETIESEIKTDTGKDKAEI